MLAPDGIAALREALARLPVPEDTPDDALPAIDAAEKAAREAEAAVTELATREAEASALHHQAELAAGKADAASDEATRRVEAAEATLDRLPEASDEDRDRRLAVLRQRADQMTAAAEELSNQAPDLTALEATLKRLRGIEENTRNGTAKKRERRAALERDIANHAEAGLEERLAETRERLDTAREEEARVTFEVETLALLLDELEGAQREARDAYFEPVAQELRPLLSELFAGETEITFCDETLLPLTSAPAGQRGADRRSFGGHAGADRVPGPAGVCPAAGADGAACAADPGRCAGLFRR